MNTNQPINESQIKEILENQREILKMQQINNLLLLSQNPNLTESIKGVATADALGLLSNAKLISSELRDIAVQEWQRIEKKNEELKSTKENDSELARQFL